MMAKVVRVDVTVLITGESGTGKELVARAIHRRSARAEGPFVAVNCSAIPQTLVESEFFGHEKGAFTDARESRPGRFEQADGGTLFLDEVGDLALDAQAKLLRALQERQVQRIGSRSARPVDVRVIAATNKDLAREVREGRFREDLYWRLNVVQIRLPALRERRDDLPVLLDFFVDRFNRELGLAVQSIAPDARRLLCDYDWPGNVRELENTVCRAMILCEGDTLTVSDLPGSGAGGERRLRCLPRVRSRPAHPDRGGSAGFGTPGEGHDPLAPRRAPGQPHGHGGEPRREPQDPVQQDAPVRHDRRGGRGRGGLRFRARSRHAAAGVRSDSRDRASPGSRSAAPRGSG